MFKHWLMEEDKELDKELGIKRKPWLGCLFLLIVTPLIWYSIISFILWIIN